MSTLYYPFPLSTVTEWPGQRPGSYHVGTDFGVPQGTELRATIDGSIVRHNSDGYGAYVLDIIADNGMLVRNGHLSRMDVSTGQRVTAGQVIGLTGGTPGTPGAGWSTGAHLHWELRWDRAWSGGAWIDPRDLNPQPLQFGEIPILKDEDDDMLTMWRNKKTGLVIAANLATGASWGVPNAEYQTLMRGKGMVKDQNPIDMEEHEFIWLESLLKEARIMSGYKK